MPSSSARPTSAASQEALRQRAASTHPLHATRPYPPWGDYFLPDECHSPSTFFPSLRNRYAPLLAIILGRAARPPPQLAAPPQKPFPAAADRREQRAMTAGVAAAAAAVLPRCGRVELAAAAAQCAPPEPHRCTCLRDQSGFPAGLRNTNWRRTSMPMMPRRACARPPPNHARCRLRCYAACPGAAHGQWAWAWWRHHWSAEHGTTPSA